MITVDELLYKLPPFENKKVLVKEKQKVSDIIDRILEAHEKYASYYDKIALYFDGATTKEILHNITAFIKANIEYEEESEDEQTTALPTAILYNKKGDCKHYSLFTAGVIDALNRLKGYNIKFNYTFASYNVLNTTPHHVFVTVIDGKKSYWIDAVPGADKLDPVWLSHKKVKAKKMALYDVIGNVNTTGKASNILEDSVAVLLHYKLIYENGQIDVNRLNKLLTTLPKYEAENLQTAYNVIMQAVESELQKNSIKVSGLVDQIAHAAAKVTLAIPRNIFLMMLRFNVRNWARGIRLIWERGTKEDGDRLYNMWYKVGGSWDALVQATEQGEHKKPLFGSNDKIGEPMTLAAALAAAAPIIAAVVPVILSILAKFPDANPSGGELPPPILPGDGTALVPTSSGNGIIDFVRRNPLILIAGAGAAYYYFTPKKSKVNGTDDLLPIALGAGTLLLLYRLKNKPESQSPKNYDLPPIKPIGEDPIKWPPIKPKGEEPIEWPPIKPKGDEFIKLSTIPGNEEIIVRHANPINNTPQIIEMVVDDSGDYNAKKFDDYNTMLFNLQNSYPQYPFGND